MTNQWSSNHRPVLSARKVAGKLQMEIQRVSNGPEKIQDLSSLGSNEGLEESEPEGGLAVGAPLTCRVSHGGMDWF